MTKDKRAPLPEVATAVVAAAAQGGGKLLTRREAANALGVSETTLRRREGEGLTPTMRGKTHMYDETLVRQMTTTMRRRWTAPECSDGGVAADVFALLAEGVDARDIVVRLRVAPEEVRRLCVSFAELGGGFFVTNAEASELGVPSVQVFREVLSKASRAIERARNLSSLCRLCGESGTNVCLHCYQRLESREDAHALTSDELRLEYRTVTDGTREVRVVAERCSLENRKTGCGTTGWTLTSEWEKRTEPVHWTFIFDEA